MSKQLLKLSPATERALTGLALGLSAAPAARFAAERPTLPIDLAPKAPAPR